MWSPGAAGIDEKALWRFIEEQIYSLPGTDSPRESFTILLTGSRAAGTHTPASDIDIDVVCPQSVYESVLRASFEAGIIKAERSFWFVLRDEDWDRYFGKEMGRPHFSLTNLNEVEQHFEQYDDVHIWIWTRARILTDPRGQFQRIRDRFKGYPKDILIRKIKYHWLLAAYWEIDVYPHHHVADDELLAASLALLNGVNETLRVFFLVEGKPFPYTEKLMRLASQTSLGREFCPMLQRVVDMVLGKACGSLDPWDRLEEAFEYLLVSSRSADCRRFEQACGKAMIAAGVGPKWVEADYDNIDELLSGELGPMP